MHLLTGALVVGGTLLIIFGWATIIQPVLGLLLICLAVQLRPRRGTVDGERPLWRADAPQLFALVDEIAHVLGTRSDGPAVADTPTVARHDSEHFGRLHRWPRRRFEPAGLEDVRSS
ncbi:hypothetical protein ACFVOK_32145 [Streptomyces sp. NPDC057798]|uniref:hypothetical protein n=1 Tax=Streptomyces sp. NPDC057798 TaxID=3346252 RepID=UPI00369FD27E